jgi:hypothetical protein
VECKRAPTKFIDRLRSRCLGEHGREKCPHKLVW